MKTTKKFLSVFIAVCCLMGCLIVPSSAYTIQNNGYDGIYINIESAPYKTLAQVPTWGQYAYGTFGCAWFASARARELTGKNIQTIWSGQSWYNSAYSSYGFSRGSTIKAKAIACYANHVSVVERVNGNNVIISEGGYTKGSASTGYCVIRSTTVSAIQAGNSLTGKFLGYVYLGVNDVSTYTVSYNANGGMGAPASQTKTHGKTLTLSSTIPTRTGYTFLGWSTSSTATTATYSAGGSFTANANTTLYAVWKVNEVTGTCGENLTWTLNEATGVLTISGTGDMDNYSSTTTPWESYKNSIKRAIIDDGVTSIGICAFYNCANLVDITIGDDVSAIGASAFYGTGYYNDENNWIDGVLYIDNYLIDADTTIVSGEYSVLNGTKVIADYAFAFCTNLTSVTIPDSVITIGNYVFSQCENITNVKIPDSVTLICNTAFYCCKSIVSITVDENNSCYSNDEYGVLFNKDKTELIKYPTGNTRTSYTIPGSVLTIGNSAFSYCSNLTSITIPDSVTTIGNSAFSRCSNLTNMAIPDGVSVIANSTFSFCSSLTNVTIPDDVTTIENSAFGYCKNLTDITIPKNTTIIEDYAFDSCKGLKNVTMSANIIEVGAGAFGGCSDIENVYYIGTEEQWSKIIFHSNVTGSNDNLTSANIHYCEEITEKPATCEQVGYTAGLYCADCENYVVGHEIIPALEHTYNLAVTEPTCTDSGYTTYTCVCGDTFTSNTVSPTGHNYENGICINCGRTDTTTPSEPDIPDADYTISIRTPSRTTIRHNDGIILHANVEGELPAGSQVVWYVSNDNFNGAYLNDGMSCVFVSKNNGYTTIYAVIEDINENELAVDSIEMRSKAGFFQKIGGFFRSLFGTTKIYEY